MSLPPIRAHDTVDSTQLVLRRALADDADLPWGTTVMARHQTAGRGRLGRLWWDAPDGALMWSTWLPSRLPADDLAMLSLAAGLALVEALAPLLATGLKWPNDILAPDRRKLAGILSEGEWRGTRPVGAIVGIGLNLAWPPEGPPAELRETAAAVGEWASLDDAERAAIVPRWLGRVRHWATAIEAGERAAFAAAWNARIHAEARLARLQTVESATAVGYIEGIEDTGAIVLRTTDGQRIRSRVGELVVADRPLSSD